MATPAKSQDIELDIPDLVVEGDQSLDKSSEDEGVAALKARVEEAKRARDADRLAREESERRAAAASDENARLRRDMANVNAQATSDRLNMVVAAIDSVTREADMAQNALQAAATAGDYVALAKAQREISRAEARLVQLEGTKEAIQSEIQTSKTRQVEIPAASNNNTDPVDRYIATLTPRSAVWMAQHRDLMLPNGQPRKELVAAHELAVAKGHTPDSDGYFAYIGRKVAEFTSDDGDSGRSNDNEDTVVVDLAPKKAPAVAAPPTRTASSTGNSGTRVTLTREQIEAAEISGMTPAEYAQSLQSPDTKARLARYTR